MKSKQTTFGQLKRGDRFSVTNRLIHPEGDNIKVNRAVLCEVFAEDSFFPIIPFNAVSLSDGRVRTFREDEKVYVYEGPPCDTSDDQEQP